MNTHAARVLVFLYCFLCISSFAQTEIGGAVRTKNANIRKQPRSDSDIIAKLKKGDPFLIIKDLPYWWRIVLKDGRKAYIAKNVTTVLVEEEEAPEPEAEHDHDTPNIDSASTVTIPACTPRNIVPDWNICAEEGSGGMNAAIYRRKNQTKIPCEYKKVTVADLLALEELPRTVRALPDSDPDAQYLKTHEGTAVVVEGYLAMVKPADTEGVNCGISSRKDLRLELVNEPTADPKTTRKFHIVTEASPWFQAEFPAWTQASLGKYASYVGGFGSSNWKNRPPTKVRIYGHLLFDSLHAGDANISKVRGGLWEVHPITRIEVFEDGVWKDIQ